MMILKINLENSISMNFSHWKKQAEQSIFHLELSKLVRYFCFNFHSNFDFNEQMFNHNYDFTANFINFNFFLANLYLIQFKLYLLYFIIYLFDDFIEEYFFFLQLFHFKNYQFKFFHFVTINQNYFMNIFL